MNYNEQVHTPTALAGQIERIYESSPDILLLGSLGRAIIFGSLTGNPETEFIERGETPTYKAEYGNTLARDIDVVTEDGIKLGFGPFLIDQHAYGSRQVKITSQNGEWFLISESKGIYEPIHPAVMEPIEGESVFGAKAKTVTLQTHQHIFGLKGDMRPKDIRNYKYLSQFEGRAGKTLPNELYEPFVRLHVLMTENWFNYARRAYRKTVPAGVRHKIAPFTGLIKDHIA